VKSRIKRKKRGGPPNHLVAPKAQPLQTTVAIEAALRQNLRLKLGHNESAIDRLISGEREKSPDASLQSLMETAIERWERENR
jgi:hypothetical protein